MGAANDSDNQIMQKMAITITSAQSEHILPIYFFLFWLVLSSLISIEAPLSSYTKCR